MSDTYPSESYPTSGAGSTSVPPAPATATGASTVPPSSGPSDDGSASSGTADTAKEQAANVGSTAKEQAANVGGTATDSAKDVASTAKDEAGRVATTAKREVSELYEETRSQLAEQAGAQQQKVAAGLHSLSDELRDMSDASSSSGVASDLVSQAASRAGSIATWLEDRDPGSLLTEVKDFARRKPGTFIAVAAVAGVLAGRLTRSLVSEAKDSAGDDNPTTGAPTPDTPSTGTAATQPPARNETVPPPPTPSVRATGAPGNQAPATGAY